jgi:hypothetical protein
VYVYCLRYVDFSLLVSFDIFWFKFEVSNGFSFPLVKIGSRNPASFKEFY